MPREYRWMLTGLAALALVGVGIWAKGELIGGETDDAQPSEWAPPPVNAPLPSIQEVVPSSYEPSPPLPLPEDMPKTLPNQPEMETSADSSPNSDWSLPPSPIHDPQVTPVSTPPPEKFPTPAAFPADTRCPWVLRVEIVDGRTQLEARTDKDVRFRVHCDRLNLEAPNGKIEAIGGVSVTAENLEGKCDRLIITWLDDKVILEQAVHVKCRKDGQEVELAGDHLSLKLTIIDTPKAVHNQGVVVPSAYKPVPDHIIQTSAPVRQRSNREPPTDPSMIQPFDGTPEDY